MQARTRADRRKTQSFMVFDARVINNIQYYYAKETAGEPLAHYVALLSATSASFSLVIVRVGHRVAGDYIPLKEERRDSPMTTGPALPRPMRIDRAG